MTKFGTTIYCPDVRTFADENVTVRVQHMLNAIDQAKGEGSDIFLGPEFFFTHHSHQLGRTYPGACIAYNVKEQTLFRDSIAKKSREYPRMLIAIGTCYETLGEYDPHLFNSAFVYLRGSLLANCSKRDIQADALYAQVCGLPQNVNNEGEAAFEFRDLECLLQICSDTTNEPSQWYDLSLVPAFQPGGATIAHQNAFTYRILSDGMGRYHVHNSESKQTVQGTGPIFHTTLEFASRKSHLSETSTDE